MSASDSAESVSSACGWISWKETKRQRKNRKPWVCRQAWLYWEEPGRKKRSCYIPKAKLAQVEETVYQLKGPLLRRWSCWARRCSEFRAC